MLTIEQKNEIIQLAHDWMTRNGASQSELSKYSGINQSYLSNMLRNQFYMTVQDKEVQIADKHFAQLSEKLGHSLRRQFWQTVRTREFDQIIHELQICKHDTKMIALISETGHGKTFAIDKFINVHPVQTYKVTVNSLYTVKDIILELGAQMNLPQMVNPLFMMRQVSNKLRYLCLMGHSPMVIIDEAENLRVTAIQMLKGLYDMVSGHASIVLIGTEQLIQSLEKMKAKNKPGAAQFYRRIKAGIKYVDSTISFVPFFEKFGIEDKGLQKLLTQLCNNYGELRDYLEPAMREAAEAGKPLTESFFRLIYNMPDYAKRA